MWSSIQIALPARLTSILNWFKKRASRYAYAKVPAFDFQHGSF